MKLELKHPEKNEVMEFEVINFDFSQLEKMYQPVASKSNLIKKIENLNIPAEAKVYLSSIAETTLKIGNASVQIGRKMAELIVHFCHSFPNTATGLVIGATVGMIISSIPVVGWAIGWLVMPLCLILGIGVGVWMDLQDHALKSKIKNEMEELFEPLRTLKAATA